MEEPKLDAKIVAVIDDHEVVLKGMRAFLGAYGINVLIYENGHKFLLDLPFVHCLVVDYLMPDWNGLDLVLELRKRGYSAPVIMLTGMSDEVSKKRLAEAGISEVVDKLSGTDAVLQAIQGCCATLE
jgi:two-component system response regulator FixJ